MAKRKNQYIFITTEGETTAPNQDYPVENCQVLGIVDAKDEKHALKTLIHDNDWLAPSGFDITQARCIQVMTESLRRDIEEIVEYLWDDEERNYEENLPEDRKDHIFNVVKRLAKAAEGM